MAKASFIPHAWVTNTHKSKCSQPIFLVRRWPIMDNILHCVWRSWCGRYRDWSILCPLLLHQACSKKAHRDVSSCWQQPCRVESCGRRSHSGDEKGRGSARERRGRRQIRRGNRWAQIVCERTNRQSSRASSKQRPGVQSTELFEHGELPHFQQDVFRCRNHFGSVCQELPFTKFQINLDTQRLVMQLTICTMELFTV